MINYFETAFEFFEKRRSKREICVEYYAYVGLRHTIRLRDGKVLVRISDLLKDAPNVVRQALAYILVAKLLRKKIPSNCNEVYRNYVLQSNTRELAQNSRKERGRKQISTSKGSIYDLDELFERLNQIYFAGTMQKPILTWSQTQTFRIFGHHDANHDTIVISQTLDDAKIPQFVVEFVLYHELLHIKHPTKIINGRRYNHTAIFRADERKFPRFEEAEDWLNRISAKVRRRKR